MRRNQKNLFILSFVLCLILCITSMAQCVIAEQETAEDTAVVETAEVTEATSDVEEAVAEEAAAEEAAAEEAAAEEAAVEEAAAEEAAAEEAAAEEAVAEEAAAEEAVAEEAAAEEAEAEEAAAEEAVAEEAAAEEAVEEAAAEEVAAEEAAAEEEVAEEAAAEEAAAEEAAAEEEVAEEAAAEEAAAEEAAVEEEAAEEEEQGASSIFYATFWSLLPPIIAIALALITKEVYSSLFVGILVGGLLYSGFHFEGTVLHIFNDGFIASLTDSYNMGILIFLVLLGTLVAMMNKAGGSKAFGDWASKHIKSRVGAQLATIALGVLIFIDDYFNCLTVGSVMRPVTDKHKISRAKLAYLIDATAAPICIIAPISSWAAAVASYVEDGNGLTLFIKAIPFNFYAILTIVMMVILAIANVDFGSMKKHEANAKDNGDLFSGMTGYHSTEEESGNAKGKVIDLVVPIIILIISCVIGMIYSGGFFEGADFITAFSNSDASVGLMLGGAIALIIIIIFYLCRKNMKLSEIMSCLPEGFKAMVPAVLILTFAWTLKGMTDSLGSKEFVTRVVQSTAMSFQSFLPAIIFAIACFLSFATGTSWGTFGILIPITLSVFPLTEPLGVVCVSASMAGAVCGDHCSPISDTTIMASAGAQCDHVTHVSTQLPYAILVAAVSFANYIVAGFIPDAKIVLPIAIASMIIVLLIVKLFTRIRKS